MTPRAEMGQHRPSGVDLFERSNLLPWCAVPYDAVTRTPDQRAAMFATLGFARAGWDWRPEHVELFGAHLDAFSRHGIALEALWVGMPLPENPADLGVVPPDVRRQIDECDHRGLAPALWVCGEFGSPEEPVTLEPRAHQDRLERTVTHLLPLVDIASSHGMRVSLYNHLGWFGQPDNQVAVVRELERVGHRNVGLVYVQHHGHEHLGQFEEMWSRIHPEVDALGVNGMVDGGTWGGPKIRPYGHGTWDLALARTVVESGWSGRVAVIAHTDDDAEIRLRDNLDGLDWVRRRLSGRPGTPAAPPRARIPRPVWPH